MKGLSKEDKDALKMAASKEMQKDNLKFALDVLGCSLVAEAYREYLAILSRTIFVVL